MRRNKRRPADKARSAAANHSQCIGCGGGLLGGSPEAAGGVAQHLGGVEVELAVVMVIGGGVPVGVGNDDAVGEHGQRVLDDGHLQGVARRKVPQHTCSHTHTGPSLDYWGFYG